MNKKIYALTLSLLFAGGVASGQEEGQINAPFAMPDVNIVEYDGRAYAFCGTDLNPFDEVNAGWNMPYWRCFSSDDLVHWRYESMLRPQDTYIGDSKLCFAGHGVEKNGKWYWYFSDYVRSTGVAIADSPQGPWRDALGKPILPSDISVTHEYDNCTFTDDDGKSYMVYGAHIDKKMGYHIVELNDDMISIKGTPKPFEVIGWDKSRILPVDAPFMHKHNGLYYLSWRSPYAVSKNIFGPYTYVGDQDAAGHLGFFSFKNQDFVNYTLQKSDYRKRYRFATIAYVHYNDDNTIAKMEPLIKKYGVGQYDASWEAIEAEWFMEMPDGPYKKQSKERNKFEVHNLRNGDYLKYPNIHNSPKHAVVNLKMASGNKKGGVIKIKAYAPNGPTIGEAAFSSTGGWDKFTNIEIPLFESPMGTISLCFVFEGEDGKELIRVDSFSISGEDK